MVNPVRSSRPLDTKKRIPPPKSNRVANSEDLCPIFPVNVKMTWMLRFVKYCLFLYVKFYFILYSIFPSPFFFIISAHAVDLAWKYGDTFVSLSFVLYRIIYFNCIFIHTMFFAVM